MKKFSFINQYSIGIFSVILVLLLYLPYLVDAENPLTNFLKELESKTLDLRFKLASRKVPSQEIVIVTIDNKSEDRIGRWPWSRDKHAQVIENLSNLGAKVIGVDLVFAQKEKNLLLRALSSEEFRQKVPDDVLEEYQRKFDYDGLLANAIEKAGNVVLGFYFFTDEDEGKKAMEHLTKEEKEKVEKLVFNRSQVVPREKKVKRNLLKIGYGLEASIEEISRACKNYGFLNIFLDTDGITRKVIFLMKQENEEVKCASFPIQIVKNYLGEANIYYEASGYSITGLRIGDKSIPVDRNGAILNNYMVSTDSFPCYSFVDVMDGEVNPSDFKDKIVLIGITDPGLLRDSWATSTHPALSGIFIHAQTIDTILHNRFISYAGRVDLLNLLAIIFFGGILTLAIPKLTRAVYGAYVALALFLVYSWIGHYFLKNMNVWLNLVFPLGCMALTYTTETLYRSMTTERKARQIRGAFQTYVPPQVVEELIKNPEKLKLGGERKVASIFFSDIKGFSTISEKLTPEELVELINSYLTPMTDIVFKHEGTLDKYIGDAIVAFFGAPLPQEDHPLRATLSALDMVKTLRQLRKKWKEENKPLIDVGMGINTGEVSVGNMGSEMRFDYTIMGDNVNIAQRLEQTTRIYKNNILITDSTYEQVKNQVLCREIDTVKVKGRTEPVKIYEPVAKKEEISAEQEELVTKFTYGLKSFNMRKWEEAKKTLEEILHRWPEDGPAQFYLEKCKKGRE